MADLHISLAAEPIAAIGSFPVMNSVFTGLLVTAFFLIIAKIAHKTVKPTRRPQGLQNVLEVIIEGFYKLVYETTHNHKQARTIFPWVMSFFLFILVSNWSGLLPGVGTINVVYPQGEPPQIASLLSKSAHAAGGVVEGVKQEVIPILRPATADLNATLALGLISVIATQFIGVQYLGFSYFKKFFNLNGINSFVGILELISEFAKVISFAFRLFGNIFAGEVLLVVMLFLAPLLIPIPFLGLEIFVGFIQAVVFAMLTMVFMSLATHKH